MHTLGNWRAGSSTVEVPHGLAAVVLELELGLLLEQGLELQLVRVGVMAMLLVVVASLSKVRTVLNSNIR